MGLYKLAIIPAFAAVICDWRKMDARSLRAWCQWSKAKFVCLVLTVILLLEWIIDPIFA